MRCAWFCALSLCENVREVIFTALGSRSRSKRRKFVLRLLVNTSTSMSESAVLDLGGYAEDMLKGVLHTFHKLTIGVACFYV